MSVPSWQPVQKKPKSTVKLGRSSRRRGTAGGKRARLRADKARRSGGGEIQAEPLPPPSWNIPGTDIPDQSRSEDANARNDLQETDRNMNEHVDVPNKDIDRGGYPPQNPFVYPGIVNPPVRGGHKPRSMAPFRK